MFTLQAQSQRLGKPHCMHHDLVSARSRLGATVALDAAAAAQGRRAAMRMRWRRSDGQRRKLHRQLATLPHALAIMRHTGRHTTSTDTNGQHAKLDRQTDVRAAAAAHVTHSPRPEHSRPLGVAVRQPSCAPAPRQRARSAKEGTARAALPACQSGMLCSATCTVMRETKESLWVLS